MRPEGVRNCAPRGTLLRSAHAGARDGGLRRALGLSPLDARRYERRRYGGLVRRLNLRLLERALARALAGVDGRRLVLDVPCGTGIIGDYLAVRGFRIVGADISPAMLEVARERAHALGLLRADLERRRGARGASTPWYARAS